MCDRHSAVLYICPTPILNCSFFMFSPFNFLSIFPGGQPTPFARMCGRPCAAAIIVDCYKSPCVV